MAIPNEISSGVNTSFSTELNENFNYIGGNLFIAVRTGDIIQGTYGITKSTNYTYGFGLRNDSTAQNDEINYNMYLTEEEYNF